MILALPPELCVHHFIIEYPNGPTSDAQCSKCYVERTFNTPYDSPIYGNAVRRFPKVLLARAEDWDDDG